MSRRLVPMPGTRQAPPLRPAPTPAPPAAMKTWRAFAFLIVTAIALYYLKWPVLIIAGLVGFFWCVDWLSHMPALLDRCSGLPNSLPGLRPSNPKES
jgi:hypothetical protein